MLSYRHHFHAGNFADVLKHFCLYETLNYYNRKDKPYLYLDTHAGAGLYQTQDTQLGANREVVRGMDLLLQATNLSAPLNAFAADIRTWLAKQPSGSIAGSVWIAAQLLRPSDSLRACELHPSDFPKLVANIERLRRRRNMLENSDGFQSLIAALPPPQHRAVILIDPPYEDKQDYTRLIKQLDKALQRFSQATLLIWYPLLSRPEAQALPPQLLDIAEKRNLDYLHAVQQISRPAADGFGMYGSGMMIYNPPYLLPQTLQECAADFTHLFAQDDSAAFHLNHRLS